MNFQSKESSEKYLKVLFSNELDFREVESLRKARFSYTRNPLQVETFKDLVKIYYLASGWQTFTIDEQHFQLGAQNVLIVPPGCRTSSAGRPKEKNITYTLKFRLPKKGERYLGFSSTEAKEIFKKLLSKPHHPFWADSGLAETLDEIIGHCALKNKDSLTRVRLRILWTHFLLSLVRFQSESNDLTLTPLIQRAAQFAREKKGLGLTLASWARQTGLSISRFKGRFREEMGLPPGDYLARLRIRYALDLLKEGRSSLTKIAFQLEYSSSQYFSTVFKKLTGLTPKEARSKIQLGEEVFLSGV